jgi:hypothetical protein
MREPSSPQTSAGVLENPSHPTAPHSAIRLTAQTPHTSVRHGPADPADPAETPRLSTALKTVNAITDRIRDLLTFDPTTPGQQAPVVDLPQAKKDIGFRRRQRPTDVRSCLDYA